ncbi:hypothetical protein ABZ848_12245 [Streptomyces sp. NPDC047081]|uniref:hypothetical protein n=1 Tax=Streptomyces sp. NPDC047081 TaxID=3154706 RepID=UPI0033D35614
MTQSSYGVPGNLEVIARVGDQLPFFWLDSGQGFVVDQPYSNVDRLAGTGPVTHPVDTGTTGDRPDLAHFASAQGSPRTNRRCY